MIRDYAGLHLGWMVSSHAARHGSTAGEGKHTQTSAVSPVDPDHVAMFPGASPPPTPTPFHLLCVVWVCPPEGQVPL